MGQKLFNLKKLDEIAQGDETFVRDMVVEFVKNVTAAVDQIQTFKSAEKWKDIAEIAHKLASNFAYLGADTLQALASDIEKSVLCFNNLTGITEKTEKMCTDGILLMGQLKEKFEISKEE